MKYNQDLTQEELKRHLTYDPETGDFYWNYTASGSQQRKPAGSKNQHGAIQIMIEGKVYYAHRLAWLYIYGEWPNQHIDHKNRQAGDNRIENLRDVDQGTNAANSARYKGPGVRIYKRGNQYSVWYYTKYLQQENYGTFNSLPEAQQKKEELENALG